MRLPAGPETMRIGTKILLLALAGAALGVHAPGHAEVSVRLSQTSLTPGQPFQITFESVGAPVSGPDLSSLEKDFQILNRSVQQQTSVRNGYRVQRSTLTLTLLPRRSGSLEIPSIAFGNERSAARSVDVSAPSGRDGQASMPMPAWPGAQGPWDPFNQPAPNYDLPLTAPNNPTFDPNFSGFEQTYPSFPSFDQGYPAFDPGYPAIVPPVGRADPRYDIPRDTVSGRPVVRGSEPLSSPSADERPTPPTSLEREGGYPGWLVALLAAGWLGTLGLLWTRRRSAGGSPEVRAATPVSSPPQAKPKSETAEERAIRAVREAYEQGDAEAARAALLQWAKAVWPDDAPNNLPRLVDRVVEPLRGRIQKLDKAFYSPTPLNWHDEPVWELLPRHGPAGRELAEAPPDGAPASREGAPQT